MATRRHIYFLRRVQCSCMSTFLTHKKTINNKHHCPLSWMTMTGDCLDYYIMYQPCVMPSSMAHTQHWADPLTHATLGWSTNNISFNTSTCHDEGSGHSCMGVGFNQRQHNIKGITHGMGFHLVMYILEHIVSYWYNRH